MTSNLIPQTAINPELVDSALKAVVEALAQAIESESAQLAMNWADATGTTSNIFSRDKAAQELLSKLFGFMTIAQPTVTQLTADHVEAYTDSLADEPPAASKDPVPLPPLPDSD